MPERSKKKPRDVNALAAAIVGEATGTDSAPREQRNTSIPIEKNEAAVQLGRLGGLKGGPARAAKLTAKKRSEIARKAAESRWAARSD